MYNNYVSVLRHTLREEILMITKPKGTSDIFGKKAKKWKYIEEIVDGVMQKYNYTLFLYRNSIN